jgi:hypothetical protein
MVINLKNFTNVSKPANFCTRGFSAMGNKMAILFLAKFFVNIKKLGGYPLKIQILQKKIFQKFNLFKIQIFS